MENRALRIIFGSEKDELIREWRKLYCGEFHNLYYHLYFFRVIKSRRLEHAVLVACIGEIRNAWHILVGKSYEN
jgi:hypothetical protein